MCQRLVRKNPIEFVWILVENNKFNLSELSECGVTKQLVSVQCSVSEWVIERV